MPRLGQFPGSKHSRRKSYVWIATGVAAVGLATPIGLASASIVGAVSSTSTSVVTTSAARVLASDSFQRQLPASLGSADTGGAWQVSYQKPTTLSVNGAAIVRSVPAGSSVTAWLPSAVARDVDNVVGFALQTTSSSASGLYLSATARDQADGRRYYAKLTFSGGAPRVSISRTDSHGVETALGYAAVTWGNVVPIGHAMYVEISVTATSPTVVSVRAWPEGTTKPAWQLTVKDTSTSQIKIAGGVGYRAYRGWSSSISAFDVTSLRASTTDAAAAGSAGVVAPLAKKTPVAINPTPAPVIPTPDRSVRRRHQSLVRRHPLQVRPLRRHLTQVRPLRRHLLQVRPLRRHPLQVRPRRRHPLQARPRRRHLLQARPRRRHLSPVRPLRRHRRRRPRGRTTRASRPARHSRS